MATPLARLACNMMCAPALTSGYACHGEPAQEKPALGVADDCRTEPADLALISPRYSFDAARGFAEERVIIDSCCDARGIVRGNRLSVVRSPDSASPRPLRI
jgi:hypothetical protein